MWDISYRNRFDEPKQSIETEAEVTKHHKHSSEMIVNSINSQAAQLLKSILQQFTSQHPQKSVNVWAQNLRQKPASTWKDRTENERTRDFYCSHYEIYIHRNATVTLLHCKMLLLTLKCIKPAPRVALTVTITVTVTLHILKVFQVGR